MTKSRSKNPAQFNLTPMIDCTFQLIIFFILVAQISQEQLLPMIVPEPEKSQARDPGEGNRTRPDVAIVNIWNRFGNREKLDNVSRQDAPLGVMEAEGYSIRTEKIEIHDIPRLREVLKQEKARFDADSGGGHFYIEVRSDMDIGYGDIYPVMRAAGEIGIRQMYMTAVTDPHRNVQIAGNR